MCRPRDPIDRRWPSHLSAFLRQPGYLRQYSKFPGRFLRRNSKGTDSRSTEQRGSEATMLGISWDNRTRIEVRPT